MMAIFSGAELLATAKGEFADQSELKSAKRLLRSLLDWHLDGRSLKTREVMMSMRR